MRTCGAGIFGASLLAVFLILPPLHDFFFVWDHNFGSAVAYACGHRLGEFHEAAPTLNDFLNRRRDDFDCNLIPANAQFDPLNAYAEGIPYFLRAMGLYWRLTGVSWRALAPALGVLFAISNTLVFLLFREFLGTALAAALALVYVFSPSNYYALTHYEHYAKTPIFLASVLIMVWLVRHRPSLRQLMAASIAGGVLIGFGLGVRADLWLLSLLFLATLLFFTDRGLGRRARWLACLAFCGACTLVALPALTEAQGASYFWLQLLQGLSSPFDADLSVRRSIYEWMPAYSDNLGVSWMQTHAYFQMNGGTVAALDAFAGGSGPAPGMIGWQAREAAGMSGYLTFMRYFPADFVTRPLAAVLEILRQSFATQTAYATQFGAANFFTRTQTLWSLLSAIGVLPVVAFMADVTGLAVRSRRQALFCLTAVLYLGGMTAIVFIPRHRVHLYFIGLLVVGVAVRFLVQHRRDFMTPGIAARKLAGVLPLALLLVALAAAVLVAARVWQDRTVGRLVGQLLAADKEPVRLTRLAPDGGAGVFEATDLVDRFRVQAARSTHFQYGQYLMATFSRDGCPAGTHIKVLYQASQPFYDDTRDVALDFRDGSASFDLIFPAYDMQEGANFGYFRGFEVPGAPNGCAVRLARFQNPAALPFLITWHLPEHWQDAPRHQVILPKS